MAFHFLTLLYNNFYKKASIIAFLFLALKQEMQYSQRKLLQQFRPAAAVVPPVKAPRNPFSFTASIAPSASKFPNPVRGTVAPQPAKSINFLYIPSPP